MNTNVETKQELIYRDAYKKIEKKANSNAIFQGIGGIAGVFGKAVVDAAVLITHYEPLINDIRKLYGRSSLSIKELSPVFGSLFKELLVDIAMDKLVGAAIPVAGVYVNFISARILTWRIGLVALILSARGEDFSRINVVDVTKLVRLLTPQPNKLKFTKPDYGTIKKVVCSVSDNETDVFVDKIQAALKVFE
ncbi:MAG: hypothetical protein IKJ88_07745 [Clostridia bacterium]|nr:hypothetical protein [Clostridia bacterium]